jgi:sucrose phosphorylase
MQSIALCVPHGQTTLLNNAMKNQVQLITYIDRLSDGGIAELRALLCGELAGLFGGVHLLPFFNPIDGADAGFDPIDHTRVDAQLGSWADIKTLAGEVDIMGDVIVNHMSSQSPQFLDYLQKGIASEYDGLFLTRDAVFPDGASEHDLASIYRPRPGLPFTTVQLASGEQRTLWTTFTPQQVDIDVLHSQGAAYLERVLTTFSHNDIRMVRLDAVGYAIKKAGTSCFMMPETFEFIARFAQRARDLGMAVLVEVHAYYRKQIEIAQQVDWVYDFALPPLLLHAFAFRTGKYLEEWIRIRPNNAITVLDTHDGIGIIDIGADRKAGQDQPGLVPPDQLDRLVEIIHENSSGSSRLATGAAASNLDLYQVNCTYYDALARNDVRYLLARAIQFFLPGIPQVYYVGLLAGENDLQLLARSGVGRDINRHYYQRGEITDAMHKPVVRQLCELIRLRNTHAAFNGQFVCRTESANKLQLRWQSGAEYAELSIDFSNDQHHLRFSTAEGVGNIEFYAAKPESKLSLSYSS